MSNSAPSLTVSVVLNWRKPRMTATAVQSLLSSVDVNHHIIVVDNGSEDSSVDFLRAEFPDVTVIAGKHNLGFSGGCNLGLREGLAMGADYLGLINNDLLVEKESLAEAIKGLESNPKFGAVTGKIYSSQPDLIWQAGGYIDHWRVMGMANGFFELDTGQFDEPCTTGWASGAMTVFRAQALEAIGLLPEEYFFGQEEWDYSTNLIKHSYQIGYVPTFVGHHGNGSSYSTHPALNSYGAVRNRHLYAEKYLSPLRYLTWRAALWTHLQIAMPSKLNNSEAHSDPDIHLAAMKLGFRRHRAKKPVTLDELIAVSGELGIASAWESGTSAARE